MLVHLSDLSGPGYVIHMCKIRRRVAPPGPSAAEQCRHRPGVAATLLGLGGQSGGPRGHWRNLGQRPKSDTESPGEPAKLLGIISIYGCSSSPENGVGPGPSCREEESGPVLGAGEARDCCHFLHQTINKTSGGGWGDNIVIGTSAHTWCNITVRSLVLHLYPQTRHATLL